MDGHLVSSQTKYLQLINCFLKNDFFKLPSWSPSDWSIFLFKVWNSKFGAKSKDDLLSQIK